MHEQKSREYERVCKKKKKFMFSCSHCHEQLDIFYRAKIISVLGKKVIFNLEHLFKAVFMH